MCKTNQLNNKNPIPWWDAECEKIKRLRRACYKKWKFSNNINDLVNYKNYASLARKTFKTKKKECFQKFAESINFHTDPSYVWKKCKILNTSWVSNTTKHHSENLQLSNKIKEAIDKVCPPWAQTNPLWIPDSANNEFFDAPFSFSEFNLALESKNANSAPGMDGIDYEILQKLPIRYKLMLVDILNEMYKKNDYPHIWKQSFLHFIPKSDSNSLRPIALTSCLCKLFESMIKDRLQWWVESNNFLPSSQQGFGKSKSCIDNLAVFTDRKSVV